MSDRVVPVELPTTRATRYLQPLREGGSLPAVLDTGNGLYVTKFRGAGQGPRALIAELVVGLLARTCDLPVPDLAVIEVPAGLADDQRDPEIRELVEASTGVNMGLRYLDGAFNFDGSAAGDLIDPDLAAATVWLDALVTNPDRTARNPNIMIHDRRPWLIDHGSALYAHHAWETATDARTRAPFPLIRDHVLLELATDLERADRRLADRLERPVLRSVMEAVPDRLLTDPLALAPFGSAAEARDRYVDYLATRLEPPRAFVAAAVTARAERLDEPARRLGVRR